MGHLKEKYTKEYFTGKNEKGENVGYGVTSAFDENGNLILREQDKNILDQINFKDVNVLSLGIGRGEEILFAIEKGALGCIGVDFSENAIEIASEMIKRNEISTVELVNEDALEFLKRYTSQKNFKKFGIVMLFDFIEHVPRKELTEIFEFLKMALLDKGIVVINTPAYKYDNDVIVNGLDKRNLENSWDTTDINDATVGMHCNKYTVYSLQRFMRKCGFENFTEMHFFVKDNDLPFDFSITSYPERWKFVYAKGYPINHDCIEDIIEYPYFDASKSILKEKIEKEKEELIIENKKLQNELDLLLNRKDIKFAIKVRDILKNIKCFLCK